MASTLLQLIQAAAGELGLDEPTTVSGATDAQTQQLFRLMNRCGDMLLRKKDWTTLQTQLILNVVPPIVTTGTFSSGSTTITGIPVSPSIADIVANPTVWVVQGTGIQQAARVLTAPSSTSVTMDEQALNSETATTLTFSRDTYGVPADFNSFIDRTAWDRTMHWELLGPMSPQEDQWVRSGIVSTGPRRRYRQLGRGLDVFRIWPPPSAEDTPATLVTEYLSNYWAMDSAGTPQAAFVSDNNTCVFPDDIMVMGLKWLFFAAKQFDYSSLKSDWDDQVDIAMAQDGGSPTLTMNRRRYPIFLSPANVADGNWPGQP